MKSNSTFGTGLQCDIKKKMPRMKNELKIIPLKIKPDLLHEYTDAIQRHQQRYDVSKPSKWGDQIKLLTNMRYISEEQWDQTAPLMSFDILKYNYIYPHIDDYLAEKMGLWKYLAKGGLYHTEHTWYNIYEDEGNQVPHYHIENHGRDKDDNNLVASGVCYLQVDDTLHREFRIYDGSPWKDGKIVNEPTQITHPKAGELYLFEPSLWHEAVQTGVGKSIVIAFNVFLI